MPYNAAMGGLLLGWYNGKSNIASVKGYYGYGLGTYNLNGGLLTGGAGSGTYPSGLEIVGVAGPGFFNQSGGTNNRTSFLNVGGPIGSGRSSAGPYPDSADGSYTLSGGMLDAVEYWR